MTIDLWILLVLMGFITFFYPYLKLSGGKAAVMYLFSTLFCMVSGVSSFYLEKVTETGGVAAYHGNQIMGLILIPTALVAAGFAFSELTEESIRQAGV